MPVMNAISTILLIIYALSTGASTHHTSNKVSNNVGITLFNDTSCGHSHISEKLDHTLTYGIMLQSPFTVQSYNLGRSLAPNEQLDFYAGGSGPGECGKFLQITSPDSNGNALHKATCYLIVGEAAVRDLLEKRDLER